MYFIFLWKKKRLDAAVPKAEVDPVILISLDGIERRLTKSISSSRVRFDPASNTPLLYGYWKPAPLTVCTDWVGLWLGWNGSVGWVDASAGGAIHASNVPNTSVRHASAERRHHALLWPGRGVHDEQAGDSR